MSRGQIIRIATAVVAVAFILIGVFTRAWWTARITASGAALGGTGFESIGLQATLEVGLRSVEACVNGLCQEADWSKVSARGVGVMFSIASTVTFFGGILACLCLAAGVFIRETQGVEQVAHWGSSLCAVVVPFSIMTVLTFPSGGSNPMVEADVSIGYSFFLTLVGAIAGAIGGRLGLGSSWDGGEYKPVHAQRTPLEDMPSVYPGPGAQAGAQATPAAKQSYDYDAKIREATATAPPPRNIRDLKRVQGAAATPDASVDAVRSTLRFVARSIEIMPGAGMSVVMEDGRVLDLLWSQVARVVARRLPPDPPYEKTLVVDVVPATPPRTPIRLLPSTQANYAALPGAAAMSSTENLRKLGLDIAAAKPGVIEPHSEGFFNGGDKAPQFQAIKQFADYDDQYSA